MGHQCFQFKATSVIAGKIGWLTKLLKADIADIADIKLHFIQLLLITLCDNTQWCAINFMTAPYYISITHYFWAVCYQDARLQSKISFLKKYFCQYVFTCLRYLFFLQVLRYLFPVSVILIAVWYYLISWHNWDWGMLVIVILSLPNTS